MIKKPKTTDEVTNSNAFIIKDLFKYLKYKKISNKKSETHRVSLFLLSNISSRDFFLSIRSFFKSNLVLKT